VEFLENEALGVAEGPHAQGGGLGVQSAGGEIALEDVRFHRNRASTSFAAGTAQGGAATVSLSALGPARSRLAVRRVRAENNESEGTAAYTAGISVIVGQFADAVFEDGRFDSHRILGFPGSATGVGLTAIASNGGTLTLRRIEIAASSSQGGGSQLLVAAGAGGSAIVDGVLACDATVTGVELGTTGEGSLVAGQLTVSGNSPEGLRAERSGTGALRIENSILWDNGQLGQPAADLVAVGAVDADRLANRNWIGDQGDSDPLFADPANGDYSLAASSGAVDAGDPTFVSVGPFDVRHAPRLVGGQLDLGALELGGLFADDFESRSTSAWSAKSP
jgi:hypothetical protein